MNLGLLWTEHPVRKPKQSIRLGVIKDGRDDEGR